MAGWQISNGAASSPTAASPAEVLAADQRITAWARQVRAAGLEGDMDTLRARAYAGHSMSRLESPPALGIRTRGQRCI